MILFAGGGFYGRYNGVRHDDAALRSLGCDSLPWFQDVSGKHPQLYRTEPLRSCADTCNA